MGDDLFIGGGKRFGEIIGNTDIKDRFKFLTNPQSGENPFSVGGRAVGKDHFPLRQIGKDSRQPGIGHQPGGDIDIVDIIEVGFRVNIEMTDQPLQGDTIFLPVITAQRIDITGSNADDLLHKTVDAAVDEGEEIALRGVQGIVEIEEDELRCRHHFTAPRAERIKSILTAYSCGDNNFSACPSLQIGRGHRGSSLKRGTMCQCMCGTMLPRSS